ncbi:TPA: hypothetical protein N0F65_011749, partial [Lagenidium giganteum]
GHLHGNHQARSARSGGATALLECGHDCQSIQALGRWRSDSVDLYPQHANLDTSPVAHNMLSTGFARSARGSRTIQMSPAR